MAIYTAKAWDFQQGEIKGQPQALVTIEADSDAKGRLLAARHPDIQSRYWALYNEAGELVEDQSA